MGIGVIMKIEVRSKSKKSPSSFLIAEQNMLATKNIFLLTTSVAIAMRSFEPNLNSKVINHPMKYTADDQTTPAKSDFNVNIRLLS